jgi:hypothetical protein
MAVKGQLSHRRFLMFSGSLMAPKFAQCIRKKEHNPTLR